MVPYCAGFGDKRWCFKHAPVLVECGNYYCAGDVTRAICGILLARGHGLSTRTGDEVSCALYCGGLSSLSAPSLSHCALAAFRESKIVPHLCGPTFCIAVKSIRAEGHREYATSPEVF